MSWLLACVSLLSACRATPVASSPPTAAEVWAAAAYQALVLSPELNEWVAAIAPSGDPRTLVVEVTPVSLPSDAPPPREWVPPELWSSIVGSSTDSPSAELVAAVQALGLSSLTPESERQLFHTVPPDFARYAKWQSGWAEFARVHPEAAGVLGLSPFVTTPDGNTGLAYLQVLVEHNHGQCGFGGVALLARDHEEWRVQQYDTTWVGY